MAFATSANLVWECLSRDHSRLSRATSADYFLSRLADEYRTALSVHWIFLSWERVSTRAQSLLIEHWFLSDYFGGSVLVYLNSFVQVVLTSRKPSPSPKSKGSPCAIPSSEQFASELLQKIAKNPKTVNIQVPPNSRSNASNDQFSPTKQNLTFVQECTEQLIVSNITKKLRSRARFHRVQTLKTSTTISPEVYAKMENNEVEFRFG